MKLIVSLFVAVVLVGCGSPSVAKLVKKNNANMAKLSVGMNKSQVVAIMGVVGSHLQRPTCFVAAVYYSDNDEEVIINTKYYKDNNGHGCVQFFSLYRFYFFFP